MATAFETYKQATSHASNVLNQFDNDPNSEGLIEFMEKNLPTYPGPYRSAFREYIESKRKWLEKKSRFTKVVVK